MNPPAERLQNPLGRLLFRRVLAFGLGFLLLASAIQYVMDTRRALEDLERGLRDMGARHALGLSAALWNADSQQLHIQLEGIMNFPGMTRVAVLGEDGLLAATRGTLREQVLAHEEPLSYSYKGTETPLGVLRLEASRTEATRGILAATLRTVLVYALIIAGTAVFLTQIFTRLVTRPLEAAARRLRSSGLEDLDRPLALEKSRRGDEIDALGDAFNAMQASLRRAYQDLLDAQSRRMESEQRFRTLFQNSPDGILIAELPSRTMRYANPAIRQLLGYTEEEFARLPVSQMHSPEEWPNLAPVSEAMFTGKIDRASQIPFRTKTGGLVWVDVNCSRVDIGGQAYLAGFFRDVTERRHIEASLLESKARAEGLARKAEAASTAKSEFLATMSHEIRTPLNGVMGMLHLFAATPLTPAQQEYITLAQTSARHLLNILSDILDLSRIEAGRLELAREPFSPADVVAGLADLFTQTLHGKDVELSVDLDPSLPPLLVGDAGRFRQILFNLLGNAAKFTEKGHVRLGLAAVPPRDTDGTVGLICSIEDSGIGIPPERMGDIFDPFTQVDGTLRRKYGGTGLGLGIVRRLIKLMDGTVCVESEPEQGTLVHCMVRLGLEAGQEWAETPGTQEADPSPRTGLRVLVAEDDRINQYAITRFLELLGHEHHCARDGHAALQALREGSFDCVLMDVQMPGMDGMEATRLIRGRASGVLDPDVPIVAMTAHAMRGDRESFLSLGMDAYLSKPMEMADLQRAMEEALAKRGRG